MANSVKNEISQELKIQEMNENMIKASKKGLDDLDPDLKKSIDEMKAMAKETVRPYQTSAESLDKKADQKIEENSINPHPPKKEEIRSGDKS